MKRQLFIALIILLITPVLSAQNDKGASDKGRQRWFKEMRQYKHDFLVKELDMTQEQQDRFFPLYDKMESEKHAIDKQTRQLERDIIAKGEQATDLEYEKAAEAAYELDGKKNAIEMRYFKEYKSILSKKQLFKLKCAERKFTRNIMLHRKKATDKKKE